ncbi:hypothetical protein ACIRP2_28300 [Streptomyces sp. NPDC101194]|uniref:hypothetical protein n=1 Tax=Streptomyces sp. NPDC101194 TaxID=3366127 RepID=UPI0037FCE9D4
MCTLHGLPIAFALSGAEADERETLLDLLAVEAELIDARPGQTLIDDKNCLDRSTGVDQPALRADMPKRMPVICGEA